MSDELPEWIKASEAYSILTSDGRNPAHVQEMIATYLRDGKIKSRAEYVWKSKNGSLNGGWKEFPKEKSQNIMQTTYLRCDVNVIEDRMQWRFIANRFVVTTSISPRNRIFMRGVSFLKSDLQVS